MTEVECIVGDDGKTEMRRVVGWDRGEEDRFRTRVAMPIPETRMDEEVRYVLGDKRPLIIKVPR